MSRGTRPVVAIGEAKRNALAGGFMLFELLTPVELPFDFIVQRDGVASRVRVRRLKQAGFRTENILYACRQPLLEMRESSILQELAMELWVRGPARAFHRYRVLPETVEELGNPAVPPIPAHWVPEGPAENVPGPGPECPVTAGEIRQVPYVQESALKLERIKNILKKIQEEKTQQKDGGERKGMES